MADDNSHNKQVVLSLLTEIPKTAVGWVTIDVLYILVQAGLDVLDDLRNTVDPRLLRWPE